MKLKEGMYVRTDKGRIGKVVSDVFEYKDDYNQAILFKDGIEFTWDMEWEDIVDAHYKLVNLVRVGDYVNGQKVTSIIPPDILGDEELDYAHIRALNGEELCEDIKIETILTKEEFENRSYVVGD